MVESWTINFKKPWSLLSLRRVNFTMHVLQHAFLSNYLFLSKFHVYLNVIGSCSSKNECNIMVKNAVDVIFGALGYYVCGYAFSFWGDKEHAQWFSGYGSFFINENKWRREWTFICKVLLSFIICYYSHDLGIWKNGWEDKIKSLYVIFIS